MIRNMDRDPTNAFFRAQVIPLAYRQLPAEELVVRPRRTTPRHLSHWFAANHTGGGHCYAAAGPNAQAEDVVQEVFVELWRQRKKLRSAMAMNSLVKADHAQCGAEMDSTRGKTPSGGAGLGREARAREWRRSTGYRHDSNRIRPPGAPGGGPAHRRRAAGDSRGGERRNRRRRHSINGPAGIGLPSAVAPGTTGVYPAC